MENTIIVKCRSCGHQAEKKVPQSINVHAEPSLKEAVRSGALFTWECPVCGAVNMVQSDLLYHDPDASLMIWLLTAEAEASLGAKIQAVWTSIQADESMRDYTFRRVSDAGSLIEKVRIADYGLDDIAVEMCKYVTAMELASGEKDPARSAELSGVQLRFHSMDGPDNQMQFVFPLAGAMHTVSVGFNVYEDCGAILRRNPDIHPSGAFPKIDSSWIKTRFR